MHLFSTKIKITKGKWIALALINLLIVAVLGTLLRAKMVLAMPFLPYKNFVHAHSHYAFVGWITLLLMVLMVYEILGQQSANKKKYQRIFLWNTASAMGMLITFMLYGYHFSSIIFSSLFTINTYIFAYYFVCDVRKNRVGKTVKVLSIGAVSFLVISSIAPYIMAYLSATHSNNFILFKDVVYSYLHLQYNGFFTLSVLALLFHQLKLETKTIRLFSYSIIATVPFSIVHNYLWHTVSTVTLIMSYIATLLLAVTLFYFIRVCVQNRKVIYRTSGVVRYLTVLSGIALLCKLFFPALLPIDFVADMVYMNKGMVIGFLHLVLLMFISLYLLVHLVISGYFNINRYRVRFALYVFATAVWLNELVLFTQGAFAIFAIGSKVFLWLLLFTAILLLLGAILINTSKLIFRQKFQLYTNMYQYTFIK